jgi:hypothetical protein
MLLKSLNSFSFEQWDLVSFGGTGGLFALHIVQKMIVVCAGEIRHMGGSFFPY